MSIAAWNSGFALLPESVPKDSLADADAFRGHFHELVVSYVFQGLLQRQYSSGNKVVGDSFPFCPKVRKMFFFAYVDRDIGILCVLSHHLTFVYLLTWTYE